MRALLIFSFCFCAPAVAQEEFLQAKRRAYVDSAAKRIAAVVKKIEARRNLLAIDKIKYREEALRSTWLPAFADFPSKQGEIGVFPLGIWLQEEDEAPDRSYVIVKASWANFQSNPRQFKGVREYLLPSRGERRPGDSWAYQVVGTREHKGASFIVLQPVNLRDEVRRATMRMLGLIVDRKPIEAPAPKKIR